MVSVGKVTGLAYLAVAVVLEMAAHAGFVAHIDLMRVLALLHHAAVVVVHTAVKAHLGLAHVVLGLHHPLLVDHRVRRDLALGILRLLLLLH